MSAVLLDDKRFFDRFPDRAFRLRLSHASEIVGRPVPDDQRAFTIVSREDAGEHWRQTFGGDSSFDPNLDDGRIAELIHKIQRAIAEVTQ